MDVDKDKERDSTKLNILPVDRGWAWVILFGSWWNLLISIGSYRAFGVMFVEIQTKYGSSSSMTSLISSLLNGTFSFTALLVTTIGLTYFSNRQFIVLGGLILSIAYTLSAFAETVEILILLLGCVSGIAHGMIVSPTMALLSQYFDKYRSLANCIALSGGSVGSLVFSVLIPHLIDQYAFSGTMLLLGAIMLHITISGLLMRPITSYSIDTTKTDEEQTCHERNGQTKFTAAEKDSFRNASHTNKSKNGHRVVLPQDELLSNGASSPLVGAKSSPLSLRIAAARNRRNRTISELSRTSIANKMGSVASALNLSNIGRYASTEFAFSSMLDLNSETKRENGSGNAEQGNKCDCLKGACAKFGSVIDCGAMKRLPFLFFIPCGCCMVMVSVIQIYLPAYAKDLGIPSKKCSFLITIISFTEMCATIFWGVFADKQYVQRHKIMSFTVLTLGIITYFSPLFNSYTVFVVYSVIYGTFGRVYFCLYPVVLIDFIGLDNLRSALGIVALTQTATSAALQPVIGVMRDEFKTYYPGMLLIATMLVCGGLFILTLPFAEKCEKHRNRQELDIHVDVP